MDFLRIALGNVYLVVVTALMIVVMGTVALLSIPIDILPAFHTPAVQVLTYYNGMPARSIERTITDRVERWVNQAPGVANVESRSVSGVSVVKLYFQDDISPSTALTQTNSLTGAAMPYLPTNTLPPVSLPFDPTGTLPLGILTVSNPSMVEQQVKDLARVEVRNRLGGVRGCVAPVVVGGKDRRIMVYLNKQRLEAQNLSPVDVVRALDNGNMMVSPGTAYIGESQIALDTNAMAQAVDDLNALPIVFEPHRQIYLRDIATAIDDAVIQKSRVRVNGRQQVFVPIYRQQGASTLTVSDGVRESIPSIESELPKGSQLEFVMDQSAYVRNAIDSLIHEGIIGAVLVSIMILIFLGEWRMTLIAMLALPLSILGAIIGLNATGNSINVMTLGGLFLAIGPLVDNAIVVLENIHRHLGMGKTPFKAAYDGTRELTLPVFVASLALVIVLCPVALTPGLGGFLFKPLTLAVGFAMLCSLFLSWTLVPALCSVWLRGHGPDHGTEAPVSFFGRIYAKIDGGIQWLNRTYTSVLLFALRHRMEVLCLVAGLLLWSLTLFPQIGQTFFPAVDAGQITIQVRAPSHLRLDATERRIIDVEKAIAEVIPPHELQTVVSEMGLNNDWSAAYSLNAGQQDTVIRLQLTPKRSRSAQEYAITLRHALVGRPEFTDLEFSFDTGGMVSAALNFGASSPIDVQITGGTPEEKAAAAQTRATYNDTQLETALTYLDLVDVYGRLAVNADTLARAEQMLKAAKAGDEAGLNRTAADINRAATEVFQRKREAIELRGRAGAVSARLAQLLLLPPAVDLQPVEPAVLPVVLVPGELTMDQLLMTGLQYRPEAQAVRALASAVGVQLTQERQRPLWPKLQLEYIGGAFGGGRNDDFGNYNGRSDGIARAVWELEGLGFGYAARVRERRADLDEATARIVATEAQIGADISEAAKLAAAHFQTLPAAQEAVQQAIEMYRKLVESSFGMVAPRAQFDAIEPLLAIQQLNAARLEYLRQVIAFNKVQFQLYTALGSPPEKALPGKTTIVDVPVSPVQAPLPKP